MDGAGIRGAGPARPGAAAIGSVGAGYRERVAGRLSGWREELGREVGSELIETAVVLPMYLMLVFGMISFAIVLFAYCNATFAAKAALRYAVVHSANSITPYTLTSVQGIVNPLLWGAPTCAGCVTVSVSPTSPSTTVGSAVSVNVTMTYSTGLPYVNLSGLVVTTTAKGVLLH